MTVRNVATLEAQQDFFTGSEYFPRTLEARLQDTVAINNR